MVRYIGGLLLCFLLLVSASPAFTQHPLDEGQQRRIGLNSQQQKQLEQIFMESGPKRRAIQANLRDLYRALHELYDSYDFDPKQARALREKILAQHNQMLLLIAENEVKMRHILTRDQFTRLRAEMKAEHERHRQEGGHPDWNGEHGPPRPGEHPEPPGEQNVSQRNK